MRNANSPNIVEYDTPAQGGHLTNPVPQRETHEMVEVDLDQSSTTGLTNRAYKESPYRPAIMSASHSSAVSTRSRRLISVL